MMSPSRWFSKCGPWGSSIGITRELIGSGSSQAPPQALSQVLWGGAQQLVFSQALFGEADAQSRLKTDVLEK